MTDVVFGPKVITLMVFIGVIILLIGAALASQAAVTKTVDNDIDTVNDYREESYSQYKNGITMMVVGNMLMVLFLLGGALNCKDIQSYVKVGMFIFSGLLIICSVWLVIAYPGPMLMTGPTILD
jgi:uncharacterized membrane protein